MILRTVSIFLALAVSACSSGAENRKEYWEQRFATELPAGTPTEQVEAFFSKAGLEHSYDEQSRTYHAVERDVSGGLLVSYGVQLQCTLAATESLRKCSASVYGDGP
jgi:hypothetical protein